MANRNLENECKPAALSNSIHYEMELSAGGTRINLPLQLAELQRQIEALPPDLNSAYLHALAKCPALVETESQPLRFLRQTHFNPVSAAPLLAAHWTKRVELFKDKAFLPMALTGEGTLHRTDMSMLSTGFLVVLPNDEFDNSVLCYDAGRLEKQAKEYQLRVAFYLLSVACENPKAQSEGIVLLFLMEQFSSRNPKRQSLQEIVQVMPFRVKEVFCVRISSSPSKLSIVSTNEEAASTVTSKKMSAAVASIFGPMHPDNLVLVQGSKERCISQLQRVGLARQSIPKSMGGDWGYESFVQWQELRTRFEWGLPPGVGGKDSSSLFDFASSTMPLKNLNDEEKIERKRRLNVLHSRRKREREKVEIEVLQEQAIELEENNRALDEDHERLQLLLHKAKEVAKKAKLLGSMGPSDQGKNHQQRPPGPNHESVPPLPPIQHGEICQRPYGIQYQRGEVLPRGFTGSSEDIVLERDRQEEESKERNLHHFLEQQLDQRQLHHRHQQQPSRFQELLSLSQQYHNQPMHPALLQQRHIQELQQQLAAHQELLGHLLEQQQMQQHIGHHGRGGRRNEGQGAAPEDRGGGLHQGNDDTS